MEHNLFKSYIIDLRDQRTHHILPSLITNIECYFNNYNIYKEDGLYTINLFEDKALCLTIKFIYTPEIKNEYIFDYSLIVLLDYNEFYYSIAEILELIYSLFKSIHIYGIMEG